MSIVAAKCPVCGRDIGFEETAKEHTCIFCGSKLLTSALSKERIDGEAKPAVPRPTAKREAMPAPAERKVQPKPEAKPEAKPETKSPDAPELTEEEIAHELERKAGFKQELREVVKLIDDLRAKRDPLKARIKTAKSLSVVGAVVTGAAILFLLLFIDSSSMSKELVILIGAAAGALGIFIAVFSRIRKSETEKEQKKLEERISEKKQKRDVLIGRLNKINSKLHIHHDE